ncbi:hypothetical protein HYX01_01770 [Candidatus Woesearchaeota archaeon]|nr:hypothetical protein [Candidatus Woesearchaeota archaeon]
MALSKDEQKELKQHSISSNKPQLNQPIKKSRKWLIVSVLSIILVLSVIISFAVVNANKPSPYDGLAKCLTSKGAVMYGAMQWCKYTQGQKAMFGNSFKYINYKEFTEFPEKFGKIKKTPTWIINGMAVENAQPIEKLAQLSGCKI